MYKKRWQAVILIFVVCCYYISTAQNTFIKHLPTDNLNFALGYCKTFDNGFVATGQDDGTGGNGSCDYHIEKFDECGNISWYKRLGSPTVMNASNNPVTFSEGGFRIVEAANHDILVVGLGQATKFKDSTVQDYDGRIIRLDPNGNIIWDKAFGNLRNSRCADWALNVYELPSGNIACIGFVSPRFGLSWYPYLLMLSGNGNFIYDKTYTGNNGELNTAWPHGIALDVSGNLIISGSCVPAGQNWRNFFLKIDPVTGNALISKYYDLAGGASLGYGSNHGFRKLSNGNFAVVTTAQFGNNLKNMSVLYEVDNNGNLIWSKGYKSNTFGNPNSNPNPNPLAGNTTSFQNDWSDDNYDIYQCANGDLVTIGSVNTGGYYTGSTYGNGTPYLVTNYTYIAMRRYTSTGQLIFSTLYGDGNSVNKARGVLETHDKGFFLNGYTTGFGSSLTTPNYYDPLFIKTDSLGHLHNNCYSYPDNLIQNTLSPVVTSFAPNTIDTSNYYYNPSALNPIAFTPQNDTLCFYCNNIPSFTLSKDTICPGGTFLLHNTTSIGLKCNQKLTIFDSNAHSIALLDTVGTDTLRYSISNPGKYFITLNSTCGTMNAFKDSILVMPQPIVTLSVSPSICPGSTATLTPGQAFTYTLMPGNQNGSSFPVSPLSTSVYSLTGTSIYGCVSSNTAIATVTVNPVPTIAFTTSNACKNQMVSLINNSSVSPPDFISSWNWTFGSGSSIATSTLNTPVLLTYSVSGSKNVTLNAVTNHGCSASLTKSLLIYSSPTASFSASSVCYGTATTYTDLSSGSSPTNSIVAWYWDYTSDGITDNTSQNPSFTFPFSGTYTTALVVENTTGCKDTIHMPLQVWGHSIPNFTAPPVCFGSTSTFTDQTLTNTQQNTGAISSWSWSFGDGSNLQVQNPTHTYTTTSNLNSNTTYTVKLITTTSHSCTDSVSRNVTVYALPTAHFSSDSVCFGQATILQDISNGNGNPKTGYDWDFNHDGITDLSGISSPSYTFTSYGNTAVGYTITSTPVSGLSCKNYTVQNVWVNPLPVPAFSFANACVNMQPIHFDATSSSIPVGTNTLYAWNYGDAQAGTGSSSYHTYGSAGSYSVTLTIISGKGCTKSLIQVIDVYKKPHMAFAVGHSCLGTLSSFTAVPLAGGGNTVQWLWDFNSNITTIEAYGQQVSYLFSTPGTHTVALVGISDHGCRDTISREMYVNYPPQPQFHANMQAGCPVLCPIFINSTPVITGPAQIKSWTWKFDNGTPYQTSTNASQQHCFYNSSNTTVANYTVELTAVSDSGCVGSITKSNYISVFPKPIAAYTVSPNPVTVTEPLVYFTNESSDFTKWWWDFADNTRDSITLNPYHFYNSTNSATYPTHLIVQNQFGCLDTAYVKVDVGPDFAFYIPNAFSPNDDGINDVFTGKGIGITQFNLWIYDRWGNMIFHSSDINTPWDGKIPGKSEHVMEDVYVWKVKIIDVFGRKHDYIGHVTVIKGGSTD